MTEDLRRFFLCTWTRTWVGVAAAYAGCFPGMPADPEGGPPTVLAIRPSTEVALGDTVVITLSRAVIPENADWSADVLLDGGRSAPHRTTLDGDGREIQLVPLGRWPAGERLIVRLQPGLIDASGRPLVLPEEGELAFATRGEEALSPTLVLRSPLPGRDAPLNLSTITLVSSPPLLGIVRRLFLVSTEQVVPLVVERISAEGAILGRLPTYHGACDPLCPGTTYRVELEESSGAGVADGPRGEVRTSTSPDRVPPVVVGARARVEGGVPGAELEASEPVLLTGVVYEGGVPRPLDLPLYASRIVVAEADGAPDTEYEFRFEGEDLAGNTLSPVSVSIRTPPRVELVISEVVPTPMHDWNDTDGSGEPLDGHPGYGAVTDTDEWVEIVNLSHAPVDLESSGLSLVVWDGSPAETPLEGAPALRFGDGGSASSWWPGEALVVRLRGSIAQRAFALELKSGTRVLDRVVVGEAPDAIARRGTPPDVQHESLARDAAGIFRWCVPSPGDPTPPRDCL